MDDQEQEKEFQKQREAHQKQKAYQDQVFAYCKAHGKLEYLDFPCIIYRLNDGTKVMWRDGFHITFPDGSRELELSPEAAYHLFMKRR